MDLEQLEFLSLVSKITQELLNHVGVGDKPLAEFIIKIHEDSPSLKAFPLELDHIDSGFSKSFMENLDRLILRMHPNHPRKDKKVKLEDVNGKSLFRELAI